MHRFRNIQETRDMVNWLESELNRLDIANRDEEVDAKFKQRQGACQVLEVILTMAAGSSNKIDALEAQSVKKSM
jgi:hypothetical protein